MTTHEILERAKAESYSPTPSTEERNYILSMMKQELLNASDEILTANAEDVENARDHLSAVMIDRLTLTDARIASMAEGIEQVISLPDPCNKVLSVSELPNGLNVTKRTVPFGVIAMIYESRPNVTSDAASLIIKSGNVAVLRSGKDAFKTSNVIVNALRKGIEKAGFPADRLQLIQDQSHDSANALMKARGYVDLLIPRGGKNLIQRVVENSTVPVIETGTGICHVYVDRSANEAMALDIIENAKCSRPSVCNAEEVLLVQEDIAPSFLPKLKQRLVDARSDHSVELRLDETAQKYIAGTPASKEDFDTEFLDYILAVKVVKNVNEAIDHINRHSTKHSETIVTEDKKAAETFLNNVDSSCVYHNVSTRFTDGGEFGFGCEIGISTQKLHARGPMGLDALCTYKYIISGDGQVR